MAGLWKRIATGAGILGAVATGTAAYVFRKELVTLNSIQKLSNQGLFEMTYAGDYGLDEFLRVGARTDAELIQFVTKRLLKGLPIKIDVPDLSCTTFRAKSSEGGYLFGRNFDLELGPSMIVHTNPPNGYSSVSMTHLPFLGLPDIESIKGTNKVLTLATPYIPMDGMNEKGLAIGILLLPDTPTAQQRGKVPIMCTTAIRMALDKAATVDEAIALFEKYDLNDSASSAYHYHVTDAEGNSAIIEYIDNEMHVLRHENNRQAATNFYQHPAKNSLGYGHDRYGKVMDKLATNHDVLTAEEAMALLEDVKLVEDIDVFSHKPAWTLWSAVYHNNKGRVEIASQRNYNDIFVISLHR